MEDEWEEEEQLVVVELSGIINSDYLSKCAYKILDIDSDKPIMQVGQHMFAGEYEGKTESSPVVKYMCHTVKKLMMQRIFLTEKKESESDIGDGKEQDTTCLSSREDNVNQTGQEVEEANLEDTAAVEM
ncbi:general transcription factor 3C polypeptide 6 isoform X2 [Thalassophryne amazonica]|uniref:general transcription factor 3C polypeptide 6 isoform X2 n=1 Tax=Thalassophryne amazonica TaxID=390379 RepID=UPI0014724DB8|nr:general transcription factor 3C polypeptide 6 isoform X2 [Thalassophryne amazonica]